MDIKIKVDYINYGELITKILPMLDELPIPDDSGVLSKILKIASSPGLSKVLEDMLPSIIDALPQDKKDELVIMLVNKNKGAIINAATQYAKNNGVSIEIGDIEIEP